MSSPLELALFELLSERPAGKSVDPAEVAKRVDPEGWRRLLPQVKGVAVGLARVGRLEILRHNKAVDPNAFRGVYRLRLPQPPVSEA
jgi:hypothetical protein